MHIIGAAASDAWRWFDELADEGIRITDGNTGTKLYEEAKEFKDNPSLEEAADCFIALLGAVRGQGWSLIELGTAVITKMAVNRTRVWEKQSDGTFHHVKGAVRAQNRA